MDKVVADQKRFLVMDPSKPAPPLIVPKMGGEGGGSAMPARKTARGCSGGCGIQDDITEQGF